MALASRPSKSLRTRTFKVASDMVAFHDTEAGGTEARGRKIIIDKQAGRFFQSQPPRRELPPSNGFATHWWVGPTFSPIGRQLARSLASYKPLPLNSFVPETDLLANSPGRHHYANGKKSPNPLRRQAPRSPQAWQL